MMTRAEHLAWCKERALEYVERGEFENAVASMCSDLNTHPETRLKPATTALAVHAAGWAQNGDRAAVERFIRGFN